MEADNTFVDFVKEGDNSYSNMRFILIVLFCPIIYDNSNQNALIRIGLILKKLKDYQI